MNEHLNTVRQHIVENGKIIRSTDSKREEEIARQNRTVAIEVLRKACPHDLIVIRYSEGCDYDEKCTTEGLMMCVRCGLTETGYRAKVRDYKWNPGTYKVLTTEPFARFASGPAYGSSIQNGCWTKGDPLDTPLDELLEWIKAVGYPHASAAWHKAYDLRKKAEEKEEQYQRFKAANIDRLTKEIKGN